MDADDAGILGNPNLEEGEARNQSQQRPDRTKRVAEHPPMPGAQPNQSDQKQRRKGQGRQRRRFPRQRERPVQPQSFEQRAHAVVGGDVERPHQIAGDAAKIAERVQQGQRQGAATQKQANRQRQHSVAQRIVRFLGFELDLARLAQLVRDANDDVLQRAERTDHRAVHPAKQQGQRQHQQEAGSGQGKGLGKVQQRRYELRVAHAFGERSADSLEIHEQQRGQRQKDQRDHDPDFLEPHLIHGRLHCQKVGTCGTG